MQGKLKMHKKLFNYARTHGQTEKEKVMTIGSQVIRDLLENGVHFGHQTNKWNPKMAKYIFGEKSGIYIIDLRKTEQALLEACEVLTQLAAEGKNILFAGDFKRTTSAQREHTHQCRSSRHNL